MEVKRFLKIIIQKNDNLDYIAQCIHRRKNDEFKKMVVQYGSDPFVAKLVHNGNVDFGKVIYHIDLGTPTVGFFANFRRTLDAIAYANYFGFAPVITYKRCLSYTEQEAVRGTMNPYEYYYEQPYKENGYTVDALKEAKVVIPYQYSHIRDIFGLYKIKSISQDYQLEEEHYKFYASIIHDFVKLRDDVEAQIKSDIFNLLGTQKVIGIHYRGSDFKNNYGNHPVAISVEEYLEHMKSIANEYPDYAFFVATDDLNALSMMKKQFGEKIIQFDDVMRTNDRYSVICSQSDRKFHRYRLGYEVIRDMYTLSHCDGIISALSQVSIMARATKLSRGEKYFVDVLLDHGINHNRRSHVTDISKLRKKRIEGEKSHGSDSK